MFLENLKIVNFRNLKNVNLDFFNVNIFYGENAQGKTNLLESIYYLFLCKSFRTRFEKELIRWGEESFYLKGNLHWQGQTLVLESALSKDNKKIKINQKTLKKQKDMVFLFPLVLFSHNEIENFKEGPSQRRYLLNSFLSTLSYKYYKALLEYHKVLYQRNLTLKGGSSDVEIWNGPLVKSGTLVLWERLKIINEIKEIAKEISIALLGKEFLEIEYFSSIPLGNSEEEISKNFEKALREVKNRDSIRGYSTVGPHRDDLILFVKKDNVRYDLRKFASSGEVKLAFIIWQLSEIKILSERRKEKPILLIDDLFGDLDEKKQKIVWNGIQDFQIFMSMTAEVDFLKEYAHFYVKNGEVF
ncbi:MAG TPA: DNA replication and repair protein RecF [Dictyoglomaceae bacterium]|nr:DNA replication and repair protein RecF [Dictyoglomaceae bacterium]HOL39191.1 DNA replication and repair protein RecF [Dictyoglomaceae bacterium]HOP94200.1 DNA replication and repair protein RecF [Dictyoglomaceae bacterium]HPP15345.1 DNA replication and repair protein RecF [Dictyoglomaceae bacterium]HPU43609.1 DNA replication and repair protein RecF [Dictyoglomaceae bacterium]